MSIYSIGRRTTGATSGNAAMDAASGSGARAKLMEMGFFLGAATASTYGLNRPTAVGTRTTPVSLLAEDPNDPASEVDTALAWSVQPTLATDDVRRISLPATIGTGVIWTFPRGLTIDTSKSIALVNRATNGVGDCHVVCDE